MGCISSKLLATTDLDNGFLFADRRTSGDPPNHVVSLTSSTYGVLNLDADVPKSKEEVKETKAWKRSPPTPLLIPSHYKKKITSDEPAEIINVKELMEDLDDGTPFWTPLKKLDRTMTPKQRVPTPGTLPSPKKNRRRLFTGKENNNSTPKPERSVLDQNRVLKPFNSSSDKGKKWIIPIPPIHSKSVPVDAKVQRSKESSGSSSSRRSLSPFFDPELVDSFEKELCEEGEQIKKMVDPKPRAKKVRDSSALLLLESYEEKCPPGGDNAVVLYTTTLRGIRKTFEDCNAVRSAIEINEVQVIERDISMDSGYREELRELMGRKEVRVPVVFVKGRLIGGADEVLRLEEEGKLGLLLEGMPKAALWCEGCGGMRFVMCMECSGSCKVLDEEQRKMVRCGECNENGLIHCPLCC
ncbi:hypothetical protein J5N97_012193 [Dioscorea zingiberensis]|uniref:Glutaredoxin domain-containing protein n=1 Tax=Dioscorea zingiberensis TaxID=325984 RepID=A0A9D5CPQ8_9LILI|nr:hypothetical protein J5N97_012193 [Dioscorea zingiberensis]